MALAEHVSFNVEDVKSASFYDVAKKNVDGTQPLDHDNMFHDVNLEKDFVNSQTQQVECLFTLYSSWFIACQC
jgi:hypothetical protein